jgi:DNA-binding transcriptional MocR family regulator
VAMGKDFFAYPEVKKYIRLSISSLNEEEIIEGIDRLSKAIKQIYTN